MLREVDVTSQPIYTRYMTTTRPPVNFSRQQFLADGFGGGFAWIDWVNSATWDGFGRLTDHLGDPNWIASFLDVYGWPPLSVPVKGGIALREQLRHIAETLAARQSISPSQMDWINQMLAVPVRRKLSHSAGEYTLRLEGKREGWSWAQ